MISTLEEPEAEAPKPEVDESEVELSSKRVLVEDVVSFKASHPIWPLAKSYKKLSELARKKQASDCA